MLPGTQPSFRAIGFREEPAIQWGNTKVFLPNAAALPSSTVSLRHEKSTQRQRPELDAVPKENSCGLDDLFQQEKRGQDCERKSRRKASSKSRDVVKCSVMVVGLLLAPRVRSLYATVEISNGLISQYFW